MGFGRLDHSFLTETSFHGNQLFTPSINQANIQKFRLHGARRANGIVHQVYAVDL